MNENKICKQIGRSHDDVIKWKHFPRYWPFVRGIHPSPVNSPHKGQWRGALMFSLICAWINDWANNRDAGDFRHHCAHYDFTVMLYYMLYCCFSSPHRKVWHITPFFFKRTQSWRNNDVTRFALDTGSLLPTRRESRARWVWGQKNPSRFSSSCQITCWWNRGNTFSIKHSSIRRTTFQNLNVSRLGLWLSLPSPLKPGVQSRMNACSNYIWVFNKFTAY